MDIEVKQQARKNKIAKGIANIIAATVAVFGGLQLINGVEPLVLVRIVLAVIVIIVNVIMGKKMAADVKYSHVCCLSIGFLYLYVMFTAISGFMYIYAFPIAVMMMVFEDRSLTMKGSIVAVIVTLIFNIRMFLKGEMAINEVIIGFVVVAIVCYIAPFITRIQCESKEESLEAVQAGAEIQAKTSDSIVDLARQLNQKFSEATEVSQRLNESMEDSNNAVSDIAASSRTNAESIQGQTEKTSDIQNEIQQVGEQASNMNEVSRNTNTTVKEGVKLIEELKVQATELSNINIETKEITQQLNESIKDVEAITETILGISSQTNLLALNASIEAARAGEAGKGFAVVADEIRGLSEGTRTATEQISEIIDNLTKDAERAAISMTKSAEYADRQNELIAETGAKLIDIDDDTDVLEEGIAQVNESVDTIIASNGLIMDAITDLSATSQEVSAATDTALALSDSTVDALREMNALLDEIKVIADAMEQVVSQ